MILPSRRSTPKAGTKPRSVVLDVDTLTTLPAGAVDFGEFIFFPRQGNNVYLCRRGQITHYGFRRIDYVRDKSFGSFFLFCSAENENGLSASFGL